MTRRVELVLEIDVDTYDRIKTIAELEGGRVEDLATQWLNESALAASQPLGE